ncbi:unnamed protein product, partial [Pylaiella littoralis]
MALVGRAIDLSWACDNSYSGETDELATIGKSVEYDYGLELAIRESQPTSGGEAKRDSPAPPMDIMRPGGGLGLVVGMMAEFVTANASGTLVDNSFDFTDGFHRAANNSGRCQHVAEGFRLVKVGGRHFQVLVESGPLANFLAEEFGVSFVDGDAIALATMRLDARCYQEDSNP